MMNDKQVSVLIIEDDLASSSLQEIIAVAS